MSDLLLIKGITQEGPSISSNSQRSVNYFDVLNYMSVACILVQLGGL